MDDTDPSMRRCVATGDRAPRDGLIRHVVGPDGALVPDLTEKLPGRGFWLTATRQAAELAVRRNAFARHTTRPVSVPADLPDRLEIALVGRAIETIGLARRAGLAVAGQAKVETAIRQGQAVIRLEAGDGSPDGRVKLDRLASELPVLTALSASELAQAFGRPHVVHVAVGGQRAGHGRTHGLVRRVVRDFGRLSGFRPQFARSGLENPARQCMEEPVENVGEGCTGPK